MTYILLQLQNHARSEPGETDVNFRMPKDTLETMLKSMYSIRDHFCQ